MTTKRSRTLALCGLTIAGVLVDPMQSLAYSYIDLSLNGMGAFTDAKGYGIAGEQRVGGASIADTGGIPHAALWNGSGFVDLNPVGFTVSFATGTSGSQQVGYGSGTA